MQAVEFKLLTKPGLHTQSLFTKTKLLNKSQNKHLAVPFMTCAFKHPGKLTQV
jgi:hypothetical protein